MPQKIRSEAKLCKELVDTFDHLLTNGRVIFSDISPITYFISKYNILRPIADSLSLYFFFYKYVQGLNRVV